MKTGEQIGIKFITTKNKTGCDSLKELHYEANDAIVKYQKKPLTNRAANRLLNNLIEIGKKLNECKCPNTATDKKDEILIQLRTMCKNLKEYIRKDQDENIDQCISVLKYRLCMSLTAKEKGWGTDNDLLNLLRINKETVEDYYTDEVGKHYSIKALQDINKELLNKLCERYEII